MGDLPDRAAALLRTAHAHPGVTRADAARLLGVGSGAVTESVARLVAAGLLAERPAAPSGTRGRPTTELVAHPAGPVVLAAAVTHETWRVDAVELGGRVLATRGDHHGGDWPDVRAAVSDALRRLRRWPGRVRGLGVSVPGTVLRGSVLDASNLGWSDVDLRALWPTAELFTAENDATLAAVAESRRGAASTAAVALHLRVEAGIGGAVVDGGRVLAGARGVAGEFGHMPFGDPDLRCPCGARGCWGAEADAIALARLVDGTDPADPVTRARQLLAASGVDGPERAAVRIVAARLGRGVAALVNGLDPDLVTLGGLGPDLLDRAPDALHEAYRDGLMAFRRDSPPPIVPAAVGEAGPITGAAEVVWSRLLDGL